MGIFSWLAKKKFVETDSNLMKVKDILIGYRIEAQEKWRLIYLDDMLLGAYYNASKDKTDCVFFAISPQYASVYDLISDNLGSVVQLRTDLLMSKIELERSNYVLVSMKVIPKNGIVYEYKKESESFKISLPFSFLGSIFSTSSSASKILLSKGIKVTDL